jgi:hypothetical protein
MQRTNEGMGWSRDGACKGDGRGMHGAPRAELSACTAPMRGTATSDSVLEYGERSSLRRGVVWGIPELRVRLGPIDDLAREAALGHERVECHGHVIEEPAARGVLPRHPHLVPVGAEGEVGTLQAKGEMVRKAHVWGRLGGQAQGNCEERRRTAMECWFFRYSWML